jgi:hypothetical protein
MLRKSLNRLLKNSVSVSASVFVFALYQGTTSVVPQSACMQWASAPGFLCADHYRNLAISSIPRAIKSRDLGPQAKQ